MMRKLKLDMNQLQVETFDTAAGHADGRGTVRGYINTMPCPYTAAAPYNCNIPIETVSDMELACACFYTEGPVETCVGDCYTQWGSCEVCTG